MTTAPPTADPVGADDVEPDPPRRRGRSGGRATRSRWWRFGYPMAVVVLAAGIPVLVWVGLQAILDSTDGQLVRRVTDPAQPGYEAVVEPTPTDLVVGVGSSGQLDSVVVLALTSEGAGGVLAVPAGTTVEFLGDDVSLRWIHEQFGADGVRNAVGELLNLTFDDAQVVTSADWARLVGPSAPITVDSPDPVVGRDGAVLFPSGEVELGADDVWPYLSGRAANESDLNRLVRSQAFWRGWFDAIDQGGPGAVPPPADAGIGRFLSALAPSTVQLQVLPVTALGRDAQGREEFEADEEQVASAVAAVVPFPEGAPGQRAHVRMLDGTGELGNGVAAAITVGAAGAEVDVVGNARAFGQERTQVIYYEDGFAGDAERVRDALGVGEVVRSDQANSATDLTVVLGEDYLARGGPDREVSAEPITTEGQGG